MVSAGDGLPGHHSLAPAFPSPAQCFTTGPSPSLQNSLDQL